ncbi:MAG TPA: T9SS type A sorting domain-containing protein [candidate division WOR-3 bacterium]|uniref:T9SS type A sorting domain-containing protein n=1 Tax=candidate division WOR-3 bacterium TaxID=2052148 RepID=A0A7V0T4K5_UNCW3|nr:T9SS type A sorting domain-containing protein [candidate division WOR-3 bacterium]
MKSILSLLLVGIAAVCFGMPHTLELGPTLESAVVLPAPSDWVDGDETLHWDGEPDRGFNINGTYSYGCAQRYTEPDPLIVKAILYYLTGNADAVFVYVAGHGTQMEPGPMLDTTRATGLGGGVWRRANMPNPPAIAPDEDFWACVIIRRHPSGQHPLTLDLGPIVAYRGGYITLPEIGPDWYQLTDPPFWTDRNVNIRAVVERAGTGVEEIIGPPGSSAGLRHRLSPNPLRSTGRFSYEVAQAGHVSLAVYDAAGNRVRTVVDGFYGSGEHHAVWDGRGDDGRRVPAGTYLYRLKVGGQAVTGRAVVLD